MPAEQQCDYLTCRVVLLLGPDGQDEDYADTAAAFAQDGHTVAYYPAQDPFQHQSFLRFALGFVLSDAQGVALMPGWGDNPHSVIVAQAADALGLPLFDADTRRKVALLTPGDARGQAAQMLMALAEQLV